MRTNISRDENSATDIAADVCRSRHDHAATPWFADLVKALWPVKGSAAVAQYAGCPDRTARAYASGEREPPGSVIRDHLRGAEGYRVLKHIMAGSTETWWLVHEENYALAALARHFRKEIDVALSAD